MNIKLTNKEASEIIKAHFFREAQSSVVLNIQSIEIEPEPVKVASDADYGNKTVELMPLIRAIRNSSAPYGGSRKIAAIKAVRSELESRGFFASLGDAKLFVEQFIP